jgi:hypothetical protein
MLTLLGVAKGNHGISLGSREPQPVAVKNAHLNGIAPAGIDARRVVSQVQK